MGDRKVKMLWQHDPSQPIGVWDEVREDETGLFVKGRLSKDVAKGREAMALLRMGAIDSMSVGYRVKKSEKQGASGAVRRLTDLDLFEVSLVTFPMNEMATVTDVKSITTEREFERFLRDAGLSRKEAVAVSLHGFNGLSAQRDAVAHEGESAGTDLSDLFSQIKQLQEKING
jgi:HK97 family phage prohead protease